MTDVQKPSPDTIARMAVELVGTPVDEKDLQAVAALLSGLLSEMGAMRAMEIARAEPAAIYEPSQR